MSAVEIEAVAKHTARRRFSVPPQFVPSTGDWWVWGEMLTSWRVTDAGAHQVARKILKSSRFMCGKGRTKVRPFCFFEVILSLFWTDLGVFWPFLKVFAGKRVSGRKWAYETCPHRPFFDCTCLSDNYFRRGVCSASDPIRLLFGGSAARESRWTKGRANSGG